MYFNLSSFSMDTQTIPIPTAFQNLMNSTVVSYGLKILWAILVIVVLLIISKFIAGMVKKNIIKNGDPSNKHIDKIWKLIWDITFYVLAIFSFFVVFEMVGFNVGLIVGGISFWVWLAFKEILGNMIAWVMILYTKEFKLGDVVEINADQVYFGRIEEITIRYTIIKTIDLRSVIIPNMTLISTPIKTFSSEPLIKLIIPFRAHYDSDTNKVIEIIQNTVNSFDFVKEKENTKTFLSNFLDSSIEFKSIMSFDPNCGILPEMAQWYIYGKINDEFAANKINIPYNMMTLNFESKKDKEFIQQNIQ